MAKKRGVPAHGRESARFHRARKKRYLVVAGGAVTERQYFKQLESIYDVVIDYQQKNESPEQLADFACKLKKEDERDISTDCYEKLARTMGSSSSFPIPASRSGCSTI